MYQNYRADGERGADCTASGAAGGAAWVHVAPWEGMFVLFAALAAISFFGLHRAMPETATRPGEKLSLKELGRDYKAVLKTAVLSRARWRRALSACRCWRGLPSRRSLSSAANSLAAMSMACYRCRFWRADYR